MFPTGWGNTIGPLQLSNHVVQNRQTEEQINNVNFICLTCPRASFALQFCTMWLLSCKGHNETSKYSLDQNLHEHCAQLCEITVLWVFNCENKEKRTWESISKSAWPLQWIFISIHLLLLPKDTTVPSLSCHILQ